MKTVLSGQDEEKLATRDKEIKNAAQKSGKDIVRLECHKQSWKEIEEKLGTASLFGGSRLYAVTGLEQLRSPNEQKKILDALIDSPEDVLVTVWKEMTPAFGKKFDPSIWKIEKFTLPKALFAFLADLKVKPLPVVHNTLQVALEQGSEWGLHVLLVRQMNMILAVKTGAPFQGPPFQQKAIMGQAKYWSEGEIVWFLGELYEIEKGIKTGKSKRNWLQTFDRTLVKLYDKSRFANST